MPAIEVVRIFAWMKQKLLSWGSAVGLATMLPAQADIAFQPAGMKVVWQSLDKEFDGFKTYNSSEGVYVTLVAKSQEKQFIGFLKSASKVSFKDGDKDLGGEFGFFNTISKSGEAIKLEVKSKKLPAQGATSVQIKGDLEVIRASTFDTKSLGPREFKKGDKLELGEDFKFTIDSLGKPKWGDNPLSISFQWKRKKAGKVEELKEVRFYTEDGQLIESSRGGSSWGGFLGSYTTTISYSLKKDVKVFKIEMDIWKDMEKVTVPLDMSLKIGG